MHYKNGREAKVGDRVLVPNNGKPYIGLLTETIPGATTCNGVLVPLPIFNQQWVTIPECSHVEDAFVTQDPKA